MDSSIKIFICCFVCGVAIASDLCMMLSPAEEAALIRAQEQSRKSGGQAQNPHTLRLDGIIYTHQKSWTVWLNGRSIKAGEFVDAFHILNVTPEFIEVIWIPKPEQRHQLCLKPNEVFQTTNTLP